MKVAEAIAQVFKQEGIEQLVCYPRQALIDACAAVGIRPIVCRQERVGAGIADGISRSTYGKTIGVFSMQGGPGIENTFAGVAQVFGDNVPVLFIPGERVGRSYTPPSFDAVLNFRHVTKWAAELSEPGRLSELLRRAFHNLRSGKPGPVLLEVSSRLTDTGRVGYVSAVAAPPCEVTTNPANTNAKACPQWPEAVLTCWPGSWRNACRKSGTSK